MSSFVVEGGHKLSGSITPQGAKNEALQIISAVLLTKEEVTVHLLGGDLKIKYDKENGHIFMTGPAVVVFDGELTL